MKANINFDETKKENRIPKYFQHIRRNPVISVHPATVKVLFREPIWGMLDYWAAISMSMGFVCFGIVISKL